MLALTRIQRQAEWRKYFFEEYSRPDYLARSVTIAVDAEFVIQSVRFNSSRFGLIHYSRGKGITESFAWQDETQSRAESGHGAYYHTDGAAHGSADSEKVITDVLSAVPDENFRNLTLRFAKDTDTKLRYPFEHYRLVPVRTSGQIHVLRYQHAKSRPAPEEKYVADLILKSLNPVFTARMTRANIRESLHRIVYTCAACGMENSLFNKTCSDCATVRPKISTGVVFRYSLIALINMSYAICVFAALGFLLFALLQVGKTYQSLH